MTPKSGNRFWIRSYAKKLRPPTRHAFDLGPHDAIDHAGQVIVEPGLEQRAQHLLHQILERARVLADHGLRQRIERAVHRRHGRGRDQPAVEHGGGSGWRGRWRGWVVLRGVAVWRGWGGGGARGAGGGGGRGGAGRLGGGATGSGGFVALLAS